MPRGTIDKQLVFGAENAPAINSINEPGRLVITVSASRVTLQRSVLASGFGCIVCTCHGSRADACSGWLFDNFRIAAC